MHQRKNIQLGIVNFIILIILLFNISTSKSQETDEESKNLSVEINILDKVSSKNTILKLKIGEEKKFQNLIFSSQKCKNSKFDDNPEITAYLQVRDLNKKNKDKVFIFNGWTFASSPSIKPFDHPVYDIWIIRCFN